MKISVKEFLDTIKSTKKKASVVKEELKQKGITVDTVIDGLGAYDLALLHDFEGSEKERMSSLIGEPGKDGKDGFTPVKGVNYFDGLPGQKGDKGDPGEKGDTPKPEITKKEYQNIFSTMAKIEEEEATLKKMIQELNKKGRGRGGSRVMVQGGGLEKGFAYVLNFTGAGVSVTDVNGVHVVNIANNGDVTKTGTPLVNQVAIWNSDGVIKGDPNLTRTTSTRVLSIGVVGGSNNQIVTPTGVGAQGGGRLSINAGNAGATSGNGGRIDINTGGGNNSTGSGGNFILQAGSATGSGTGGSYTMASGSSTSGNGGAYTMFAGDGNLTTGTGGSMDIAAGNGFVKGTFGMRQRNGFYMFSADGTVTATKQATLDVSAITGSAKVFSFPNATGTVSLIANTETLTNKTFNLTSNTLSGTKAQFDTACSDDNFVFESTVYSGVYTPTVSNGFSVDTTPTVTEAQYMRVGSTVTVSGRFTCDPSADGTLTGFEMSLPVASVISNPRYVAGTGACGTFNKYSVPIEIYGNITNNTAQVQFFPMDNIDSHDYAYHYTYRIAV